MGATVPEGDWYCPDCATSRDEHLKSQSDTDSYIQDPYKLATAVRVSEPPISIFEIVADERTYSSLRLPTIQVPEEQRNDDNSACRNTSRRVSQGSMSNTERSSSPIAPAGETVSTTQVKRAKQTARTLRNCRNLHSRICVLRENWNALRAGSLAFSSNLLGCGAHINERKQNNSRSEFDLSGHPEPSHTAHSEQIADAIASRKSHCSGSSREANKAWKMMEVAKSAHETEAGNKMYHSPNSFSSRSVLKQAEDLHWGISKGRNTALTVSGRAVSEENKNFSPEALHHYFKPQYQDKQIPDVKNTKLQHVHRGDINTHQSGYVGPLQHIHRGDKNTHQSGYVGPSSVKQDRFLHQDVMCDRKGRPASWQVMQEASTSSDTQGTSVYRGSFACLPSGASNLSFSKPGEFSSCTEPHDRKQDLGANSDENLSRKFNTANSNVKGKVETVVKLHMKLLSREQHLEIGKIGADTYADERSLRRSDTANNNAKHDIQSLVKLNLKLLSKEQNLGADKFKEVARAATHTILAACGLEHSKSRARAASSSVCKHAEKIKQMRKSNLMPNSCRECFYNFVQDVVKSILSERLNPLAAAKFS